MQNWYQFTLHTLNGVKNFKLKFTEKEVSDFVQRAAKAINEKSSYMVNYSDGGFVLNGALCSLIEWEVSTN